MRSPNRSEWLSKDLASFRLKNGARAGVRAKGELPGEGASTREQPSFGSTCGSMAFRRPGSYTDVLSCSQFRSADLRMSRVEA